MTSPSLKLLLAAWLVVGTPALAQQVVPTDPAAPTSAPATPEVQSGFVMGYRLGLAFPNGKTTSSATVTIGDAVQFALAGQLEGGWRWGNGLGAAVFVQIGPAKPGDSCLAGMSCSAAYGRLGLMADWRFRQREVAMPWVGLALGYEGMTIRMESDGASTDMTFNGMEVGLLGGVDFRLGEHWAIGPSALISFTSYRKWKITGGGPGGMADESGTIPSEERTFHQWFVLGVKASKTF